MGNATTKTTTKELPPVPPTPPRDSIGYVSLQEKARQLKEQMLEEAINEYELVDQFIESENV